MKAMSHYLGGRELLGDGGAKVLAGPILILLIMSMLILPLPPFALDMFFTFNIALALMVLLVSMFTLSALEFAAFPAVLLFTTLLENLTSGTRSVEQIVVDGLLSLFRTLRDDQHMARILMIEIYGVPYDQQRLYERSIGRFSDMLLQFMQRFLPAPPDDPDVDLELLATGLVGVCIQMAQRWVIKGYRQTPEQLAANCMLIFRGLGQQTGLLEQTISPG